VAATLHIWRPSPPSATWGRAMPWWQVTHITWHLRFMVLILEWESKLTLIWVWQNIFLVRVTWQMQKGIYVTYISHLRSLLTVR
jgi:hypothetical protein